MMCVAHLDKFTINYKGVYIVMNTLEIGVNLISGIVESLCIAYLCTVLFYLINKLDNITQYKKNFLKFWSIILVSFIVSRVIHIYFPSLKWLKSIVFISATSISANLFYKTKIYKGIIIAILNSVLSAILEVVTILILKTFDIQPLTIASNMYYNSIYACSIAIIETLIGLFIYKISVFYNQTLATVENKLKYFLPQLIAIIICMFPTMALLMLNDFKYSGLLIIVNILQLFVVSFVGIFNLKFVAKHENTELKLANTIIHNETLSKVNEGVRGFKHDMGNIVQAILGYIAINDAEGAKKYCQNLVIGFNDINILSILSPKVIDDPAIYGVVVNKILIARDKNMTLSLDINTSVSSINFPKFELSRILGILLDNAIEAGEQTNDKKLVLNMYHDYVRNVDIIIVSNSINNINIDKDKIFNKNYSTKERPSGFGLYEVNKFLKQNPQSYILTTIDEEEKMFTQTLTIDSNTQYNLEESTVA